MRHLKTIPRQIISIIRYPRLFLLAERTGRENRLGPAGRFYHHRQIHLGNSIYIAPGFHISAYKLRIGNGVQIGPGLLIECHDHTFNIVGKTLWELRKIKNYSGVSIEDDVWIGGKVSILKGVSIGEGTVVGASSVVTRSLPPYAICVGTPCKPIKRRFTEKELEEHLNQVPTAYNAEEVKALWKESGL
ncbi:MAG: acyltransferase [Bacteroidales bacterium]|nr:acyltransferase [Bacteroidales bacterium]